MDTRVVDDRRSDVQRPRQHAVPGLAADAGTGDSKFNESAWAHFSDASVGGTPAYRCVRTACKLDQIILSPGTYLSTRPGSLANDTTIVPRP